MACYIFGAGSYYGLRSKPDVSDYVIAADGGWRWCRSAGLTPDLLLGDFDSLGEVPAFDHILRVPVEKDDTDTGLALREGLRRGCGEFFIYGGTGGRRLDHTLANLQSLAFLRENGARGWLYDRDFVYTVIKNETLTLRREVDWGLVSLFALGDRARGVTLTGLQYPLDHAELTCAFPLGVSNHFAAETATVTVEDGLLLVGQELPPLRV